MTNILDRILETKRADVAARKASIPLAEIDARIAAQSPPRGFRAALDARATTGHALVAEIKKASPSKGLIRADFDPPAHARAYQAGGAACLSVLTDERWFQGADAYLTAAREACTLPVLRKDFMVDPWQVPESRALGADAILLIMAALDDGLLAEIEASANDCGMDVLVEVHDEREMERAMKLKSRLIGVNNRDLRDFTVDFARTYELIGKAPAGCTFIAESGLMTHADLDEMATHGVHCFLIGEALMRQEDVEAATRAMIG
ncbi:indole-3-glycerol phosphate synthase TrpC [Sphingomonas sp. AR_OL41]|uniref:indole-3-glycerol phosphate synthase TrpC n=1 Tax=Sphingomonas sp. AR_OL41 TaxID=3042729 RepID=UPI0024800462|nr:indole-3-glycerol phosphate synthase TrpC [Sphingomonas sp. AR_OL41]MDH7973193.1 indole-3-glycerol phosphate synthase TrpC [Sphingomonas sp. AR_OL41]